MVNWLNTGRWKYEVLCVNRFTKGGGGEKPRHDESDTRWACNNTTNKFCLFYDKDYPWCQ